LVNDLDDKGVRKKKKIQSFPHRPCLDNETEQSILSAHSFIIKIINQIVFSLILLQFGETRRKEKDYRCRRQRDDIGSRGAREIFFRKIAAIHSTIEVTYDVYKLQIRWYYFIKVSYFMMEG
jgi:hypothetical protein